MSLKAEHSYHYANSIEGLDRYQEQVRDDFGLIDHHSTFNVEADVRLFSQSNSVLWKAEI